MKLLNLTFIVLIATHLSFCSFSQRQIDVVFYNVENLFDTINQPGVRDGEFTPEGKKHWTSDRYKTKLDHIQEVMNQFEQLGVMGVCEIENKSVLQDLIVDKPQMSIAHVESNDARGIDVGLIYNHEIFNCDTVQFLRFELEVDGKSKPTRDILIVQLSRKKETYFFIVNHWPSRRGGQEASDQYRVQAAKQAEAFILEILTKDPDANIVFMGDLNDYPENNGPQIIGQHLQAVVTRADGKYGGSYNYRGEWNLLDHMFVSNNLVIRKKPRVKSNSEGIGSWDFLITEYKDNLVPFRTYGGSKYLNGYSDHLPIYFQLQF